MDVNESIGPNASDESQLKQPGSTDGPTIGPQIPPTQPPVQDTPQQAYPPASIPPSQPAYPAYPQPPYSQPVNPQQPPPYPGYSASGFYPTGAPPSQPQYPPYGYPAAPSAPFQAAPYGQVPPGAPMYLAPPPAPKRGLKAWHWVLIGVSSVLILCCGLGLLASAAGGGNTGSQNLGSNGSVLATDTPAPTNTPASTNTPAPTATPIPGLGDHMALGHDYKQDSSGFYIVHPASKFSSRDQIAYVVTLDQGIGTTQAKLVLVKVRSGGVESVEFSVPINISNPDFNQFANRVAVADLMYGESRGTYKLEMQTDTDTVASAKFTFTG